MSEAEKDKQEDSDKDSWEMNPTIVVSSSNKIKLNINLCDDVTEDGQELLENIRPLDESRYHILQDIAQGGAGKVYEFFDKNTSRKVAMKTLLSEANSTNDKLAFVKEALITANLEHPSIVPIHEIALNGDNDTPIYSMKKLNGQLLTSILTGIIRNDHATKVTYNLPQLLQIYLKVCDAVAYSHSQNVLHLDIKPENVMIGEFGDVLLMDWGLAEHIGNEYKNDELELIFTSFIDNKYNNHIHGTPGYMAPEQIQEGPESFDRRTDIHALGGLLYSLLTCRRPFAGKTQLDILQSTIDSNLPEPTAIAPHLSIPEDLSAVAMKAMKFSKEERYQSVSDLKNDINNFLLGYAVSALKETWFKKLLRFYRHHRNLVNYSLILMFFTILTFTVSYAHYLKTQGSWQTNLDIDLSNPALVQKYMYQVAQFIDGDAPIPASSIDEQGLSIGHNKVFLGQPGVPLQFVGDVKIELDFEWGSQESLDAIEICFNSELNSSSATEGDVLKGYSVQVASWIRQFNNLSRNYRQGPPNLNNSSPFIPPSSLKNTLTIERRNPNIYVYLNGEKILEETNSHDFTGRPYGVIRLRCWDTLAKLKHLRIMTQKRAQLVSPLDVGDVLTSINNHDIAAREYLKVVNDIPDIATKTAAAKKYIQTLYVLNEEGKLPSYELETRIKSLKTQHWSESINFFHINMEAVHLWKKHDNSGALEVIKQISTQRLQGELAQSLLLEKHHPLDKDSAIELLKLIALKKDITSLDLSGLNLTTLAPLKNLKLKILKCENNNIRDISALTDMPLENLFLTNNKIEDLTPLTNMPLRQLMMANNPAAALPNFTHKSIELFIAPSTKLKNISPLKGHPLTSLIISSTPVKSLAPITGIKTLLSLTIDNTDITDISPVKDSKLRYCFIRDPYSTKKKELHGLQTLDLSRMINIAVTNTDLKQLPDLSNTHNLKRLIFTNNKLQEITPMREIPRTAKLKLIDLAGNAITDGSPLSGLSVDALHIAHNKVTDLSFLDDMSIRYRPFIYSPHLSSQIIDQLLEETAEKKNTNYDYQVLKIMSHIQKKEFEKLKDYSVKIGERHYLYVWIRFPFKSAQELARLAGGTLICYETEAEYKRVNSNKELSLPKLNYYMGLELKDNETLHWASGTPLNWDLPSVILTADHNRETSFSSNYFEKRYQSFRNKLSDYQYFVIEFKEE